MATNRIDILDSALLRPGRIDRKIEFPPPNEEVRNIIFEHFLRFVYIMICILGGYLAVSLLPDCVMRLARGRCQCQNSVLHCYLNCISCILSY